MKTFGAIEKKYSEFDSADILLQPISYDGTSTWGKGADKSLAAFLKASENMELYDLETDSEVYKRGIHLLSEMKAKATPEKMFEAIYQQTKKLLNFNKFLTFLGGEHSISIGIIKAFYERYSSLTVLHLDAHADLRPSYLGSKYNHACAVYDASQNVNLIQVGIRSMDSSEKKTLKKEKCFFAQDMYQNKKWMKKSIDLMTKDVYLTLDLDVLDPSIMPATGTPEPGGMDWYTLLEYLKKVFKQKNILGFDLVEFSPLENNLASDFLVAKLYYKLLSYKFKYHAI